MELKQLEKEDCKSVLWDGSEYIINIHDMCNDIRANGGNDDTNCNGMLYPISMVLLSEPDSELYRIKADVVNYLVQSGVIE